MRALHLASFDGNIGDVANHNGFWKQFRKYVNKDVEVTNLEMREFYKSWSLRKFDEELVDYINTFDFFVVGGGNFFDVKWEYSPNGITFGMSTELMDKIKIPIIFNALGVDMNECQGFRENTIKFGNFLKYINSKSNIIVSIRDDGSDLLLEQYFSDTPEIYSNIHIVPDNGFFTQAENFYHPEIPDDKTVVAMCIVKDRIKERWKTQEDYEAYCIEMSEFIMEYIAENNNIHFVFVPHIPLDLQAIYDVISHVDDAILRRHISVAPYVNGLQTPGDYIVDLYGKVAATIGMRFHSNICSMAYGTPAIPVVTLKKLGDLYYNIGFGERIYYVEKGTVKAGLKQHLDITLKERDRLSLENKKLVEKLDQDIGKYFMKIKDLLKV